MVTLLEVIEHVASPAQVLAEAKRVLDVSGCLIISTPWVTPFWKVVWAVWERTFGRHWLHQHVQEYTGWQLRKAVEDAGFEVERHVIVCFCDQVMLARKRL